MCIDFKNFNSAFPKDYYPLSNIDCKVESVMGFKYKCFLDAYKGYHSIQMANEDKEKTAFYTDQGMYCYTKMPFGLQNAGATYQRNDEKMLLEYIFETFDNLRRINMKLNLKNCSFGVDEEVVAERDDTKTWTLFTDGESSVKRSGAGLLLIGPNGIEYTYAIRLTFDNTNKESEYEVLLSGLRIARKMKLQSLKPKKVDVPNKLASVAFNHLTKEILVEVLDGRSTKMKEINVVVEEKGDNWMTSIINFLEEGIWSIDKNRAHYLWLKIYQYVMEDGVLYKKIILGPHVEEFGPIINELCYPRNTYRGLRDAFWTTDGARKINEAKILLAHCVQGREGRNTELSFMPNPCPHAEAFKYFNDICHGPLAILSMRCGHF
nr:reverse transcriptase domain-containing protein [Tanacetum cinerariifolium]